MMYKTKLLFLILMLFGVHSARAIDDTKTNNLAQTVLETDPPCNPIPGLNVGDTGCITFVYQGQKVTYTTVRGTDGYVWLQQNLGSNAVAVSETDVNGYGDYFQWGRSDDGHQLANSPIQTTAIVPNDPTGLGGAKSNFISSTPSWWNLGTTADSWSAETTDLVTANDGCDPCKALGAGWALPTETDWKNVVSATKMKDIQTAFDTFLKLTVGGSRGGNGGFNFVGQRGYYWSSTPSSSLNLAKYLYYSNAVMNASSGALRSQGAAVRCILKINEAITHLEVGVKNNQPAKINVYQGTLALESTVYQLNQSQDVIWSISSGSSLASVDAQGVVTAIVAGQVTVRATSVENPTVFAEISIPITNQIPPCNKIPGENAGDTGCVTFTYNGETVQYTTVRAADGEVWLQQNLGSTAVGTTEKDVEAYGDLFQWGRWDDGHQFRKSPLGVAPPASDPTAIGSGNSEFLTNWWNTGVQTDQWNAADISNLDNTNGCDPCKALGAGWAIPTEDQWKEVVLTEKMTNILTAFDSNLKLTIAGTRSGNPLSFEGVRGFYWSKTAANSLSFGKSLYYSNFIVNPSAGYPREQGQSVRCIFNLQQVVTSVQVEVKNNLAPLITVPKGTLDLEATVLPSTGNQSVYWKVVSGFSVASVDSKGRVQAIADGKVVVRAISVEDHKVFGELEITIAELANCETPTAIKIDNITSNSANLTWNSTATAFDYEVRTSGAGGSGAVGLYSSGSITTVALDLKVLLPNTTYTIYIRSNCGAGDISDWASGLTFSTLCETIPVPTATDQVFCGVKTVADLEVSGLTTASFNWYNILNPTEILAGSSTLVSGTYHVIQVVDQCASEPKTVLVTINDLPQQPTVKTPQVLPTGSFIKDIEIVGAINPVWYATEEDAHADSNRLTDQSSLTSAATYYVVNQSAAGCFSEISQVVVILTLKTDDFNKESFAYYPNPTKEFVTVDYSEKIISYVVFDLQGRQLKRELMDSSHFKIDFSIYPAGVYLVDLHTANAREIIRIIKK